MTKWIFCSLLLFVACAAPEGPVASSPEPGTAAPASTSETTATYPSEEDVPVVAEDEPAVPAPPSTTARKNVSIETVEIANPIVIAGQARTFESNVVLRVRDANGKLITEGFTTATGEMGKFSPYRGTLWLTRDPGARVIVEALEYSAKDGSEQSVVRVEKPFALAPVQATLYFPDANCTGVAPYTRRIPKTVSLARLLVEALVAGPTAEERAKGASSPFPRGSRVESVILRNGTITVDFNERLRNVGGSCAAQMIRASVTDTLRRLPAVQKVVITAGGSEPLALQP